MSTDPLRADNLRIAGIGGYVPRLRLEADELAEAWDRGGPTGIDRTAVPEADEDVLTMAYEAAATAMAAAGVSPERVQRVILGTTTPPLEEESTSARLASALGIDGATTQLTGSTAAGVDAVREGLVGNGGPALVVASDAPRGTPDSDVEHAAGAGAAALVLAPSGPGVVRDVSTATIAAPGTRFRPAGERATRGLGISRYDRERFIETVATAAEGVEYDGSTLDAAAVQATDGGLPYRACETLGVTADQVRAGTVVHDVGDAGTASPLLGLATAVDDGCESVLVAGYGSGAEATVALVDVSDVPTRLRIDGTQSLSYTAYLRRRGEITPGEPAGGGAYVSVPSWRRTLEQRHRLVAGVCDACGTLNLPPEGACVACHELTSYERVELPGTGTIETATVIGQGGAPPEFVEQQARSGGFVSAIVALDGPDGVDDSVSLPMQVVAADDTEVSVGDRVETTIRKIYTQEGVPRYGRKAILVRDRR